MTAPDVHEIPLEMSAVEHDDFIDGLEPAPAVEPASRSGAAANEADYLARRLRTT
jgi:hypothetical protein